MDLNKFENNSDPSDKTILSKLRRLKIQENIITQNLRKSDRFVQFEDFEEHQHQCIDSEKRDIDYNIVEKKLKDRFINIKSLFDEVQAHVNSKELLVELDMDDMKRKILELENNIKQFKSYLNSELNALKNAEPILTKQLEDSPRQNFEKIKRYPKISSNKYNNIVPSPVRALMTSPLKCLEVQQFQDFMKNSPNRYGGWNEYNHNIFVRFWQKCFGPNYSPELEDGKIQLLDMYDVFVQEMSELHGVNQGDVLTHIKWYVKYIFLKEQQQAAIDKWKWNKRSILKNNKALSPCKPDHCLLTDNMDLSFQKDEKSIRKKQIKAMGRKDADPSIKKGGKIEVGHYRKPTKQSMYRTYLEDSSCIQSQFFIQETSKLCIPIWRRGLGTNCG